METNLRPCPFCGDTATKLEHVPPTHPEEDDYYFVRCTSCGGESGAYDEPETAAYWWNGQFIDDGRPKQIPPDRDLV